MSLPSSGSIAFSQIQSEFGGSNPISLSEYYRNGSFVPSNQFNGNVPTSGQISMNQFYSTDGFNSFGQHVIGQSGGKIVQNGWLYYGNSTFGTPEKVSVSGATKILWAACFGINNIAFICRFQGSSPYNSNPSGRNSNIRTGSQNGSVIVSTGFTNTSAIDMGTGGTYAWCFGAGTQCSTTANVVLNSGTRIYHNWS